MVRAVVAADARIVEADADDHRFRLAHGPQSLFAIGGHRLSGIPHQTAHRFRRGGRSLQGVEHTDGVRVNHVRAAAAARDRVIEFGPTTTTRRIVAGSSGSALPAFLSNVIPPRASSPLTT